MAEDYRPTLENVEAIMRLFGKYHLMHGPYPSVEECQRLRMDPQIAALIDHIRQHAARRIRYTCEQCGTHEATASVNIDRKDIEFVSITCPECSKSISKENYTWIGKGFVDDEGEAENIALIETLKKHLVSQGINAPEVWIAFNTVDWHADMILSAFPPIINQGFFSEKAFEIIFHVHGPAKVRDEIEYYLSLEDEPGSIDSEIYLSDLVSRANNKSWESLPVSLPGEGQIVARPQIASSCINYGWGLRTRMMIWFEDFGKYSESQGIDEFIDYFNWRFASLFKEVKMATSSDLRVFNFAN
ncbi:MAG: hypothetical protein Q6373_007335 [Candidatus Sigynarchaeota archaeon]